MDRFSRVEKIISLTYAYAKLLNFEWSLEIELSQALRCKTKPFSLELGEKWQPFKSTSNLKKIALLEHVPV